jgi:hypothetical protein
MSHSTTLTALGKADFTVHTAPRRNQRPIEGHGQRTGSKKAGSYGMKFFSDKSFSHLLFELHKSAYSKIEMKLQELEQAYPGALAGLCKIFELNFSNASTQGAIIPKSAVVDGLPAFDVHVRIDESRICNAHKCDRVTVMLAVQPLELGEQRANTNHLIVALKNDNVQQSFIVPLPLVLKAFESAVCKPNTFQVYQHTLIRRKADVAVAVAVAAAAPTISGYVEGAGEYVGITSRTWQRRSMEHQYAARRGSLLRFHRALRGELFEVLAHEHIVLRAGLNRPQALHIEEVEVEARTLHDTHPNGLNMIPGGEAGLRFLSTMLKRPASSIQVDDIDGLLEEAVNKNLRQPALGVKGNQTNAKLAALWQESIEFRIKAMTYQGCRMSYPQIRCARIWHAAGWSLEKIHANLTGLDGRALKLSQVQRLLEGKSYETIPHLIVSMG